eukprot:1120129-Rhodomonas_salina.1
MAVQLKPKTTSQYSAPSDLWKCNLGSVEVIVLGGGRGEAPPGGVTEGWEAVVEALRRQLTKLRRLPTASPAPPPPNTTPTQPPTPHPNSRE